MTHLPLAIMTLAGVLLLRAWFSGPRVTLSRTGDFFMLAWFYYAFAIPLDLLVGLEIRPIVGGPDFSDPELLGSVMLATLHYLVCGLAFLVVYRGLGQGDAAERRATGPQRAIVPPPLWVIVLVHVAALALYGGEFLYLSRAERFLLAGESHWFRFKIALMMFVTAFDLVCIVVSRDRRWSTAVAAIALAMALLGGDRTDMMMIVVCYVLRWGVSMRLRTFVTATVLGLFFLSVWKYAYAAVQEYFVYGTSTTNLFDNITLSFSGLDAYGSFMILTTYLDEPSPYWLGTSYLVTPLLITLPRALRGDAGVPLAEEFTFTHYPELAEAGFGTGFSALAEAWLNFGPAGCLLLGVGWAAAARYADRHRHNPAFYVFALMTCRLFRSDFASLWKSWGVLIGGGMLMAYLVLRLLCRSTSLAATPPVAGTPPLPAAAVAAQPRGTGRTPRAPHKPPSPRTVRGARAALGLWRSLR